MVTTSGDSDRIEAVTFTRAGRTRITFSDGSVVLVASDVAVRHALAPGIVLSARSREDLLLDQSRHDAFAICWKHLALRSHSERELRVILTRKRTPDKLIEQVISRLKELGYIDDGSLARELIRRLKDSGHGPLKIRAELARKGLRFSSESDGDIHRVSQEKVNRMAILKYERLRALPARTAANRLISYLARRGFTPETVHAAVRAAMSAQTPDDLVSPDS